MTHTILPPFPRPNVSHETEMYFDLFQAHLQKWNEKINLVARSTLANIREIHIDDSLNLVPLIDDLPHGSIVDFGSGAGFPALILALMMPTRQFYLVESDQRKSAFLREAIRILSLTSHVTVINKRIEDLTRSDIGTAVSVITSRATANLTTLLEWSYKLHLTIEPNSLTPSPTLIFPKGEGYAKELTEANITWYIKNMRIHTAPTPAKGVILVIKEYRHGNK